MTLYFSSLERQNLLYHEKKATIVRFLKSYGNQFEVKFPKLKKPLIVSRYYYEKMINNPDEFKFIQ